MPNAFRQVLRRLRAARPTRRRRQFEPRPADSLETRILPTAIVTFTGAAMTITGDTGPNAIAVTRVGTQVHVDAGAGFITVNGTDVNDFFFNLTGAFNLTAKFGDDADALQVGLGLQLKSANIAMGDGGLSGDIVQMSDVTLSGKLTIDTNNGSDIVQLGLVSVTGTTLIDLGWGSDILQISQSTFTGATTIKTDIGFDIVQIVGGVTRTKFVGKLTVTTGDDADIVQMFFIDSKAFSIDTGDDADIVQLTDFLTTGAFSVKTGAGDDDALLALMIQSGSGTNTIDVGSGQDDVSVTASSLAAATTINLGSGFANTLEIDDVLFNGAVTLNSQGTLDVIDIEQNTGLLGQTQFTKAAKFNLGLANTVNLGTADPASFTKFLASATFTGHTPFSDLIVTVANVSFFSAPVLTKVTRTDI